MLQDCISVKYKIKLLSQGSKIPLHPREIQASLMNFSISSQPVNFQFLPSTKHHSELLASAAFLRLPVVSQHYLYLVYRFAEAGVHFEQRILCKCKNQQHGIMRILLRHIDRFSPVTLPRRLNHGALKKKKWEYFFHPYLG